MSPRSLLHNCAIVPERTKRVVTIGVVAVGMVPVDGFDAARADGETFDKEAVSVTQAVHSIRASIFMT